MSGMTDAGDREERAAPDWVMQGPRPAEPMPEDHVAPPHARRRFDRVLALASLLILLIVAVGTSPYWAPAIATLLPWSPHEDADAQAARLAQIEQHLDKLTQQQAALDQRLARTENQAAAAASSAALRDLAAKVAALEQHPAPASTDPAEIASLRGDLDKLAAAAAKDGERLAKLEARSDAAGNERGNEALLLALGQLRTQLESGHPFTAELQAVEALARNRADLHGPLQPLAAAAAKGVPRMTTLTQRFKEEVAPAMLRRAAAPPSDDWGDSILARLRSLIVIRRVGDAAATSSDPVEAAVAQAEQALSAGDLAGAVAAIESMPPQAAAPAREWLADAHRRLSAEQALAKLSGAMTAQLAADQAQPAGAKAAAPDQSRGEDRDR
jgi:hypothetical protein